MDYIKIIYIFFGVLPSFIWLLYYLRKDLHPEPKRMIINVFLWGAIITVPVVFIEKGLQDLLSKTDISLMVYSLINYLVIVGFVEEFFKFFVIKVKVINSPHLDEPLDIMLYMVVAALGFAAVENVFFLLQTIGHDFNITLAVYIIRFVGAVFLHTLCSAVIGYALAISFCEVKTRHASFIIGLVLATVMHGMFDFAMVTLNRPLNYIIPAVIILTLAFIVFAGFEKLKKMKSICKIN